MTYVPPLADMRFVLKDVVGLSAVAGLPGLTEAEPELVDHILEEGGKLAAGVLAPLNVVGDRERAQYANGAVRAAPGFADAYRQFSEGGWNGVPFATEWGGTALPALVNTALWEMWDAANLAFSLCPLLTQAGIEALERHGSEALKRTWLPKLVSGEWTGTMNLTEPQSGTDLGAIRCRAERDGDRYRLRGQKIFITWGDHDMTDNIVHMVLARSPDGPPGTRGLSLFLVPKFLLNDDGTPGPRNDVRPVSIEHKLGIHGSPTCIMAYGENDGAVGWLVGEENRGIEAMFVMMNNARMAVGLEGLAIAERAYQQAVGYARTRVQGRAANGAGGDGPVAIIRHADVRRMLMDMKCRIEAMRALCYDTAARLDAAARHPDPAARAAAQARVDLMIPVVKAWCTDTGLAVTSPAVQVHGGMGFIEETGAAQHYRDARITTIYEGTNGVQAMDLVGRKVARDGGEAVRGFLADVRAEVKALAAGHDRALAGIRRHLGASEIALDRAVRWLVETAPDDPARAAAGAVPFLELMGLVGGGLMLARSVRVAKAKLAAGEGNKAFLETKVQTASFFADYHLSRAPGLLASITEAGEAALAVDEEMF